MKLALLYLLFFSSFIIKPFSALSDNNETIIDPKLAAFNGYAEAIYKEMHLKEMGLSYDGFRKGLIGYYNLKAKGQISDKPLLSIVDMTKSSTVERLFIINLAEKKLLFKTLCAHGTYNGFDYAEKFSNVPESHMSSQGFFVTLSTYDGKHGLSLQLEGMDIGFNDKAKERDIVIHGADYVSKTYAAKHGRLGRSWGCPAVPNEQCKEIVTAITDKTCFFVYFPSKEYEQKTIFLNENIAASQFFVKR